MGGLVFEHAEHHDLWPFLLLCDPLKDFEAVLARQLNVEQHGIRKREALTVAELSCASEIGDGFLPVPGAPDDLKAAAVIQRARQYEGIILGIFDHHHLSHAVRHTSHYHHNPLRYLNIWPRT